MKAVIKAALEGTYLLAVMVWGGFTAPFIGLPGDNPDSVHPVDTEEQ